MQGNTTADRPVPERTLVTAAEWFAGGRRIPYDPVSARIPDEAETSAHPGTLQGDSDKPRGYRYSTLERADLVGALWRHQNASSCGR